MDPLVIELPWPEGCFPNERLPDFLKRQKQQNSRLYGFLKGRSSINLRVKQKRPFVFPRGGVKFTITAYPKPRGKIGDDDNIIAALKWARDGIAEALKVDDKLFVVKPVLWGSAARSARSRSRSDRP
jgi:hypothetical protein